MTKRLAVVINPTAGGGRAITIGRDLREQLHAAGHELVDVSGASALEAKVQLEALLAADRSLDAVIAVGGDGLVNLAASAVVGTQIPLAIIPAGTGDDIARGIGIDRRSHRDIAALVRVLAQPELPVRAIDVGQVSSDNDAEVPRYFFSVLTAGLDAEVNARANRMRFGRGKLRYVAALVAQLRHYRSYDYEIRVDGRVIRRQVILAAVANLRFFGGGMRIAPQARPDDGRFQLVLVDRVSLPVLLWIFPRIFWGGHVKHRAVQVMVADRVELRRASHTFTPAPFADGEPIVNPPLRCEVRPGALQIIKLG